MEAIIKHIRTAALVMLTLITANGDRLTGTLADKGLELKTAFGVVEVLVARIQRVTCGKGTMIEEEEIVQDRGAFIPKHHYPALKGKVVGVLVGNALDAIAVQEGGGGSPEALVFSTAGSCYRWVYVSVQHNWAINTLDTYRTQTAGRNHVCDLAAG